MGGKNFNMYRNLKKYNKNTHNKKILNFLF